MSTDDRDARIHAIAAKALMLEPGGTFEVPVAGGVDETDLTCDEIEAAIEDLHIGGVQLLPELTHPREIAVRAVKTAHSGRILVERSWRIGS